MEVAKSGTTMQRLKKLAMLANLGREDSLRKEFEKFQLDFTGTRQGLEHRLKTVGDLAARPTFADGTPIGTMGYKLLRRVRDRNPDTSTWVPAMLDELVIHRRIASVAQALEWLLSPQEP